MSSPPEHSSTLESQSEIVETARSGKQEKSEFLYLDQTAVLAAGILDMTRAVEVVSEAQALFAAGECRQPHKVVLRAGNDAASEDLGRLNALFGSLGIPRRVVGMKWVASFPSNLGRGLPRASALIVLNSPETGLPLAVMDGTLISAIRTGAMTALGARYLAPRSTRRVGIIGAGVLARTQILGLITVLPNLECIAVTDLCRERAESLAEEFRGRWQAPVEAVKSVREALSDAEVSVTVTTAHQPMVQPQHIKPGALTVQVAGHEYEFEVLLQCRKIVIDNWEAVKERGISTPAIMHAAGLLRDEDIYASLGQLILGEKPGRESDEERIHFAHIGMGINDVALAWAVYTSARERKLGQLLRLWEEPLWT